MKKKIWGVLLSVAVLVTTVNFPTTAGAEENKGGADASGIVVKVSDDMNGSNANESDEIQTVQISAQNQSNMDAVVRIFLLNEDKETADTEVEIPNLCDKDQITDETVQTEMAETLKSALTLESGTNSALDAQWIEKKDDSGNVTAKYLETALPAGTAAAFDMQLMYRTDEENYTKKTIVRAKAFVDEQDVTKASDVEDEDNEAEVKWEMVQSDDASEAAEESEDTAGTSAVETRKAAMLNADGTSAQADDNTGFLYYVPSDEWINNGYTIRANMQIQGNEIQNPRWSIVIMSDSGLTLDGKAVYIAEFATDASGEVPYGGVYTLQIQAYEGESHKGQVEPIASQWTTIDVFNGKLWNGNSWVTFTPDVVSLAGTELNFTDMTQELSEGSVTAIFRTDNNNQSNTYTINGTFRVPEDYNGTEEYTEVQLNINNQSTQWYSLDELIQEENTCYYYGMTEPASGNPISGWAAEATGNESISGRTLYFSSGNFSLNDTIIIEGKEDKISERYIQSVNTLYYEIPDDISADQETIITVIHEGTTYHFLWKDLLKNKVVISDDVAEVSEVQSVERVVYFDATLSKLDYGLSATTATGVLDTANGGVDAGDSIPAQNGGNVYYWMRRDQSDSNGQKGTMEKINDNLYKCTVPAEYTEITFAAYDYNGQNAGIAWEADGTDWLQIPALEEPCFYADSGDDATYKSGSGVNTRGGYWAENGTRRDAEKGKGTDVVDIVADPFVQDQDTMYVNSTFYDYYTDYELNGNNRDDYSGANGTSQRNWVTFRHFNQALSEYYRTNEVSIPIYTGHFQLNNDRNQFQHIADTLNLFGWSNDPNSNDYKWFLSTNNSVLNVKGDDDDNGTPFYDYAAWGLVNGSLNQDQLYTSDNEALEPHFNKEFLLGDNSINTKLGEVYENVEFPFTKEDEDGDGVSYWTFDSAETTLQMKQDTSTSNYYLEDVGNQDWARNVNSTGEEDWRDTWDNGTQHATSTEYGFFPFNATSTGSSGVTYNYGFGTKIEFNFRLTDDGTVVNNNGAKIPITFEFSGDDDVWVFIDGKLALDVGGAHGRVTGNLNFQSKTATVSAVKASAGNSTQGTNQQSSFTIEGENGSVHTLTMYYMERGMWESNMRITFNFPDENLFEVEKELDTSGVDEDFIPALENASFDFEVGNAVTHYGEKAAANDDSEPVEYNDTFDTTKLEKPVQNDNLFQHEDNYGGYADVVHWRALHEDNAKGEYRNERWGIIHPEAADLVDISDQEFLSFDFYFADNNVSLSLNNIWLGLEDADGTTVDVNLSAQKIYGSSSLARNRWQTIRVYLNQFTTVGGNNGDFDWTQVTAVKFSYRYYADIYLDNIRFIPPISDSIMTGFVVQQQGIPSYGSVNANQQNGGSPSLQNAEGAVYTLSDEDSSSAGNGRVDKNGVFPLQDGQTASFSNQFRIGSYLSLSEINVDPDVFTTSWTLYDSSTGSDIPVTSYSSGNSVTVGEAGGGSLAGVSGTSLEDNRVEIIDENSAEAYYTNQSDTSDPSIVFRSYTNPDSEVIITKLKAVVTNKVNTGSITIRKDKADNSADLSGSYTFNIVFTNVAGLSLESEAITKTVTVAPGETATITGIPIGTEYVITEAVDADSDSRLESIEITGDGSQAVVENNSVRGTVNRSTADCTFQFNNTTRPLIDIHVEKEWQDAVGTDIGGSIQEPVYVQLQRKYTDAEGTEHGYESVEVNGQNYVTIQKSYSGWVYDFVGLEMYQDDEHKIPYTYRVVEGTIDEEGNFTPVAESGIIVINGQEYDVAYQYQETTEGTEGGTDITEITGSGNQSKEFAATIVNKIHQRTNLEIVKVDATKADKPEGTEGKYLPGVIFSLEKGTAGSTSESFTVDENFGTAGSMTGTTGDGTNDTTLGQLIFEDLEEGIYRITETKAAAGYSLLKSPLYLVIDREYGCTIQEGSSKPQSIDVDADSNTITITVSNRLLFELPSTGGYLRAYMIAGGLALAGIALFIYRLQKRRKGARAPRR
mgnify:CR=1 FL=1